MTDTFTPGPWAWDCGLVPPDGPQRYADVYTDGGNTIIATFNDLIPEGRANARLIAAAPDLLAVAKMIENAGDNMISTFQGPIYRAAKAATAKAEGRS